MTRFEKRVLWHTESLNVSPSSNAHLVCYFKLKVNEILYRSSPNGQLFKHIALENISLRHNTHIRSHIIKYYKEESQNETYTNNRNAHSNNVPFSMESFILISKTLCMMCRTLIPAKANGATIIRILPLIYRNSP